jgi:hypothetical protein
MIKKNLKSVYLDATIISYLVDKRQELKTFTEITNDWWKTQRKHYAIFISPDVIAELEKGNYPNKSKAMEHALGIEMLKRKNEILDIASIYTTRFLMPKDLYGDAMHLAYTSYYKIDFLLTWNCKHLANANKKEHIRILNTKLDLFVPEIITPMELFII